MSTTGVCSIKEEFVLPKLINLDVKETLTDSHEPSAKSWKKFNKKAHQKGQNKERAVFRLPKETELCNSMVFVADNESTRECSRADCPFIHDITNYLSCKPPDLGEKCYNFDTFGHCPRGLTCRFGSSHIKDGKNITLEPKCPDTQLKNQLTMDFKLALRKRQIDFSLAEAAIRRADDQKKQINSKLSEKAVGGIKHNGVITDEDIVPLRPSERKPIDWKDKLFLSPLTTLGNLPFRRICVEYGADVTCGEMAMCSSLLQGLPQEWALLRRHHTEKLFGAQICANNPQLFAKTAQLLAHPTQIGNMDIDLDFVDLNLGCPIDLVYQQGGGCALLRRQNVLECSIRSMSNLCGGVNGLPITAKMRTGVYSGKNIAHKLVPKVFEWGAQLVTVHGRSKEQRYTRSSDWKYIQSIAQSVPGKPIVGNGDILSLDDYERVKREYPEITAVMVGRGALIKPWIFKELKEQKANWDISSEERFEVIRKFSNYGLEHWGSDTRGVETTRRFLLEWLSFLYRYVPVGVLERPPQHINERPPPYRGRNDLETLMASSLASDWIKISEMLLGKVPDGFTFVPKHKANAFNLIDN